MGAFLCGRKKYCNNSNHNHKKVVSLTKGKKVESVVFIIFSGVKTFLGHIRKKREKIKNIKNILKKINENVKCQKRTGDCVGGKG